MGPSEHRFASIKWIYEAPGAQREARKHPPMTRGVKSAKDISKQVTLIGLEAAGTSRLAPLVPICCKKVYLPSRIFQFFSQMVADERFEKDFFLLNDHGIEVGFN